MGPTQIGRWLSFGVSWGIFWVGHESRVDLPLARLFGLLDKWAWRVNRRGERLPPSLVRLEETMSAPLLLRAVPLLRLRHHRLAAPLLTFARRPWCCSTESSRSDVNVSYADKNTTVLSSRDPANYPRWDDPDFRKWKNREEEILRDIEPITSLTKEILHSDRYVSDCNYT